MLLDGKVVLVTGGGRSIGAAICRVLARHGATVAINYSKSKDRADALADEIKASGGSAMVWCADVTDTKAVAAMIADIHKTLGRLDGVVNNAIGGNQYGKLESVPWQEYQTAFEFSTKAVLNTVNAARPIMKAQGGGRVVNIVTEQWNFGSAHWGPYMAGKGAMIGLSRVMADELGPENITVNMVSPGWMRTEKVTETTDTSSYTPTVPLRRQGDAEEIGNACAFLMSDLAGFISGAFIPVSGGTVRLMGG